MLVVEIVGVRLLFWVGGWAGVWSDKTKLILNSVLVEVEVGVELCNVILSSSNICNLSLVS